MQKEKNKKISKKCKICEEIACKMGAKRDIIQRECLNMGIHSNSEKMRYL